MKKYTHLSLRLALIYAAFGLLWISLSDTFLASVITDTATLTHFQTYKGFLYVVITAALVFFLMQNAFKHQSLNEEKLQLARLILESASEAIFVSDLNGNLLEVNAAACRLAKYSREQMLRLRNVDIVAPNQVANIKPELEKVDDGTAAENIWNLLSSDGSIVPLQLIVQRIPGDRYLAIGRDLTEHKKQELQLNQLNFAMSHLKEMVFLEDEEGYFKYVNDEACRVLGYTRDELLRGMSVIDISMTMTKERWKEHWQRLRSCKSVIFEGSQRTKDGSVSPVEVNANYFEFDGQCFVMALVRDISERKSAEQTRTESIRKLEEKELAKTRFLAAAGHDLRQPLAAANLFIDALKFANPTSDQNQIIQRLDQAMSNFNDLLDALLNVSKMDAGVIRPEFTSINVADIFNWLEESFAPMVIQKDLRFKLHFPTKRPLNVRCDLGLLKSVLMNLVSNAIKFTEKGGILVSARQRGEDALFQVWDTGIGISVENIEKVFDDFYQIDNQQRDRRKGLGLGLSIAKRAIALINEKIDCHSKIGHGTVFEFHLPIDNAFSEARQEKTIMESQVNDTNASFVNGKRFIVLEDDLMVAEALSQSLTMLGAKVESYSNAEIALKQPNIENADCYIVDYMLKGNVDGINFLHSIHQRKHEHSCAVIMSGDTSTAFIRKTEMFDYPVIHKPVNISTLISRLIEQHYKII